MRLVALVVGALAALILAWPATAAPGALYGIQDDAWLTQGPGTLESRLDELDRLGVDVVRYTVRWDVVAAERPVVARDATDLAYDWRSTDAVLRGLRRHGISPVLTLYGTPRWANGGRGPNWAPSSASSFGEFARAAATRYGWVRQWTIWNEPNRAQWLQPTSASTYVRNLLNPAYAQIHAVIPAARVGGGMTAPRAGAGGVSPVSWIKSMGAARARLDAYAHHPYPGRPQIETPWAPACRSCTTIAMADLERLVALVHKNLGRKRIWLTEFGYQTNPPDVFLGVSPEKQAEHVASAARRVQSAPFVDMLIFFLVRDDAAPEGWQSGFTTVSGVKKPAYTAFRLPLVKTSRNGQLVGLWGQIREGTGRQTYRLRVYRNGGWVWLGGTRTTDARGAFSVKVRVPDGALVQLYAVRNGTTSLAVRV
ncbi:MAG TPA: glycosyl hydrolase [Gaiellaceae bacterium]|nr:glycosyl hydrolase [Gaiellaceae bacterium]